MSKAHLDRLFPERAIKRVDQLDDLSQDGLDIESLDIEFCLPMVDEPVSYLVCDILPNQRMDGNYIFHAERFYRVYIVKEF